MANTALLKSLLARYSETEAIVNDLISTAGNKAFASRAGLSNQVLSRNPHNSPLYHNILLKISPPSGNLRIYLKYIGSVFSYYPNGLLAFSRFLIWYSKRGRLPKFSPPRASAGKKIYVIDTFLLAEDVLRKEKYRDSYFEGLYPVLEKNGHPYLIFPSLIGWHCWREASKLFSIISQNGANIVTEFQLLKPIDIAGSFVDILLYPWQCLRWLHGSDIQNLEHRRTYRASFATCLTQINFDSFIRYRASQRLAEQLSGPVSLIDWFENQVIDKNLYRALREKLTDLTIYGCQPYIYSPAQIHFKGTACEHRHRLLPDHLLVNGPHFFPQENNHFYEKIGYCPSFRYRRLFDTLWQKGGDRPLLLFCYFYPETFDMIELTRNSCLRDQNVISRSHPRHTSNMIARYRNLFPPTWSLTNDDFYELLKNTSVLITSESGGALEAAALGIPVIIVANQSSFTCNPMPAEGRGEVWDWAFDSDELSEAFHRLKKLKETRPDLSQHWAKHYLQQFFTKPTEEAIASAFEV